MALIECPECKKKISQMAGSCPNCGFSMSAYTPPPKKMGLFKKILIGFGVLLVLGFIINITKSPEEKAAEQQAARAKKEAAAAEQAAVNQNLVLEQEAILALINEKAGKDGQYGSYEVQFSDYTAKGGKIAIVYEKGPMGAAESEVISGVVAMLAAQAVAATGRSPSKEGISFTAAAYYPHKRTTETRLVNPHGVSKYNPKTDGISWHPGEDLKPSSSVLYQLLND